MAGLVLSLRPNEKFLVNGVVLQNGDRRSQIRVEDDEANVLRLSDALHPDLVNTPTKRVYYVAQLMITGDLCIEDGLPSLLNGIDELHKAFVNTQAQEILCKARRAAELKRFYSALNALKRLLPLEEDLLSYTPAEEVSAMAAAG